MRRISSIPTSTGLIPGLVCSILLLTAFCHAAPTVRLLNGPACTGRIDLDNNALVVTPDQGSPTRVELANVWDAVFNVPTGPNAAAWPPGAFLTNGSFVAGDVKLTGDPAIIGNASVPSASIAWALIGRIPFDKFPQVAKGRTGAILPNGDFFEGDYRGVNAENRIVINSAMFGPHPFVKTESQIAAVVIRDLPEAGAALNEITTSNGSRYLTDDLHIDPQGITFHDSILGEVKIKNGDIRQIRAGKKRYQFLTDLKPMTIVPPAGMKPDDAFKVLPGEGTNAEIPASVVTAVNAAVTFPIPQGATIFSTDIAIPKDAPADTRLTFAVYADGMFLLSRSPMITVGDKAQTLRVTLGNVHTLVLRAEPAAPGSEKSIAQWTSPMFLRP